MTRHSILPGRLLPAAAALSTGGCKVRPAAMKKGHSGYARAGGRIQDELPLNLVRLRYRATPVRLEV